MQTVTLHCRASNDQGDFSISPSCVTLAVINIIVVWVMESWLMSVIVCRGRRLGVDMGTQGVGKKEVVLIVTRSRKIDSR